MILRTQDLEVHYPPHRAPLRAVDGISLAVPRGTTLALVGESGCGKSTCGRALLQLTRPTAGEVFFDGEPLTPLWRRRLGRWRWSPALRALRRRMQPIFQDPYASLDPRRSVGASIAEPLDAFRIAGDRAAQVAELLAEVGLDPAHAARYPHAFSGGQRQRIVIARALALRPELIVADEPIAALDVSIQAQILNLLVDLQRRHALTYVFISHDLAAVRHIADAIAVMYLGRIVEQAPAAALVAAPAHPYTQALWAAVPTPDPTRRRGPPSVMGEVPKPRAPPPGCPFHPRCPRRIERCAREVPALRTVAPGHRVACHLVSEVAVPPAI